MRTTSEAAQLAYSCKFLSIFSTLLLLRILRRTSRLRKRIFVLEVPVEYRAFSDVYISVLQFVHTFSFASGFEENPYNEGLQYLFVRGKHTLWRSWVREPRYQQLLVTVKYYQLVRCKAIASTVGSLRLVSPANLQQNSEL